MNAAVFSGSETCSLPLLSLQSPELSSVLLSSESSPPVLLLRAQRRRWLKQMLSVLRHALSGMLLSTLSARAEAPVPSQEFWNYLVEFGDAQGELFDPSDYAAVTDMPAKAQREIDRPGSEKSATDAHDSVTGSQKPTDSQKNTDSQKSTDAQRDNGAVQEQPR